MRRLPKPFAAVAVAVVAAFGLAACGSSSSSGTSSNTPTKGGTLRLLAASGFDHLDTVSAYYTADYVLERAYARQLLAYPYAVPTTIGSPGWNKAVTPAADMATEIPTTANGGITNGGKTYTFHIKSGVDWNYEPSAPGDRVRTSSVSSRRSPTRSARSATRSTTRHDRRA